MTSKERIQTALNHKSPDKVAIDFGGTPVSGIHIEIVAKLRAYFGLGTEPVKVTEPYQMLGEIEQDLMDILGCDVLPLGGKNNMFGIEQADWKEQVTPWGQTILVPGSFGAHFDNNGDWFVYPEGDTSVDPSAKMPHSNYFFDALERNPGPVDDATLNIEDNLEEFKAINEEDLEYWRRLIARHENSEKALMANMGGTGLGDIALVPAMQLKNPKGIRDISEWYMSVLMRPDFVREVFDKQTDIAIENMKKFYAVVGDRIDAIFLCGTDFGTQNSTFCGLDDYNSVWMPYYKKMTSWIHENTGWKVFKHSCGAVESFIDAFIESGFDILNPVQISASGMDPALLKEKYGNDIVFWGGGVDTQKVLSFGSPKEVEEQVLNGLKIFSKDGGFVFNTVHNTQALTPIPNFIAMLNAIRKFNGEPRL